MKNNNKSSNTYLNIYELRDYICAFEKIQSDPELFNKIYFRSLRIALDCSNNTKKHYTKSAIPKKDGTKRYIFNPDDDLRMHQTYIKDVILNNGEIASSAYAYVPGKSLKDNANEHYIYKQEHPEAVMVKLDIKDFFPSITAAKVYAVLRRNYPLYRDDLLVFLTNICCLNGKVPQGACTSPVLSNMVFAEIDYEISEFAQEHGICFTRYSDDLCFSFKESCCSLQALIEFVENLLKQNGFRLNRRKTKVIRAGQRFSVTGINTGSVLQVGAYYRREIRKTVYYLDKYGCKSHLDHIGNKEEPGRFLKSLIGKIQYVLFINPDDEQMENNLCKVKMIRDEYEANYKTPFEAFCDHFNSLVNNKAFLFEYDEPPHYVMKWIYQFEKMCLENRIFHDVKVLYKIGELSLVCGDEDYYITLKFILVEGIPTVVVLIYDCSDGSITKQSLVFGKGDNYKTGYDVFRAVTYSSIAPYLRIPLKSSFSQRNAKRFFNGEILKFQVTVFDDFMKYETQRGSNNGGDGPYVIKRNGLELYIPILGLKVNFEFNFDNLCMLIKAKNIEPMSDEIRSRFFQYSIEKATTISPCLFYSESNHAVAEIKYQFESGGTIDYIRKLYYLVQYELFNSISTSDELEEVLHIMYDVLHYNI